MLLLKIDYILGDGSTGAFGISIVNKNTEKSGRVRYSIEAENVVQYGSLDHYWAWSESLYSCVARVIYDGREFLADHMGRAPVEALTVSFAGKSPYGGNSAPAEMSRVAFTRNSSGARVTAEGKVSRGVWPIPIEKSNATLPWQIIFLCQLCGHVQTMDFAAMPDPPIFAKLAQLQGGDVLFLEDVPVGVEPWVRAYVAAFYPLALKRDGTVIDVAAWNDLEHPTWLYHRTAAVASVDDFLDALNGDEDANSR